MRELLIVVVAFAVFAGLAIALQFMAQPAIFEAAWVLMALVGAVAVVAEVAYFAGLYIALRSNGTIPERWYARSFAHHHLMNKTQRRLVLPFFFFGFLGLLLAMVLAGLLVFASFGTFQELRP